MIYRIFCFQWRDLIWLQCSQDHTSDVEKYVWRWIRRYIRFSVDADTLKNKNHFFWFGGRIGRRWKIQVSYKIVFGWLLDAEKSVRITNKLIHPSWFFDIGFLVTKSYHNYIIRVQTRQEKRLTHKNPLIFRLFGMHQNNVHLRTTNLWREFLITFFRQNPEDVSWTVDVEPVLTEQSGEPFIICSFRFENHHDSIGFSVNIFQFRGAVGCLKYIRFANCE